MPRANRYFLPGYVWHITHRCHRQEFLLKYEKHRRLWMKWLFESRKRFGLCVLNYTVTSNHIHLLVEGFEDETVIPRSMQLVAGKTAQAYNLAKGRRGAFWEDRYHATAVQRGSHLRSCMFYVDLNMVRAGVVHHPGEWKTGGFHELLCPRERYGVICHEAVHRLLDVSSQEELSCSYRQWLDDVLAMDRAVRQDYWTESLAVGDTGFVSEVKEQLGIRASRRSINKCVSGPTVLREEAVEYGGIADESRLLGRCLELPFEA